MRFRAPEIVKRFQELDKNDSGSLPIETVREEVSTLKTNQGEPLVEKEVEFFVKGAFSEKDTGIGLGQFADLLARINAYKRPPKRK